MTAFSARKDFSDGIIADFNKYGFFSNGVLKCANIWEIYIIVWTNTFQIMHV